MELEMTQGQPKCMINLYSTNLNPMGSYRILMVLVDQEGYRKTWFMNPDCQ